MHDAQQELLEALRAIRRELRFLTVLVLVLILVALYPALGLSIDSLRVVFTVLVPGSLILLALVFVGLKAMEILVTLKTGGDRSEETLQAFIRAAEENTVDDDTPGGDSDDAERP